MTNPFDTDFTKLLSGFQIPGIDLQQLAESQRRNFEALTQANQRAIEGMQTVMRRQGEAMHQTMEEVGQLLREIAADPSPQGKAKRQTELIKRAFEKTVADMRELSELVARSNSEAAEVLMKRVGEGLNELKQAVEQAKKS